MIDIPMREGECAMTRILPVSICLLLLVGCAFGPGPGIGMTELSNGRTCFYAFRGNDLHFVVVTDGNHGSYGATSTVLLGPGWSGEIRFGKRTGLLGFHNAGDDRCPSDRRHAARLDRWADQNGQTFRALIASDSLETLSSCRGGDPLC